jgi:peptidoglycan/xylan/chitin deacetylase (PgdA/CDA1 family)
MSENHPFVSVVVPALNEEKLLGLCLNSLKEQDYAGKYEIIVVDNASTDRTPGVAADCGARVVTEPNIGTGPARQRGLLEASGEIVAFTDADTIVPRHWLSTLVRRLRRSPKIVAVTSPYAFFDSGAVVRPISHAMNFIFIILDNAFRYVTRKGGTIWGSSFAGKRQELLKTGGFDTSIKYLGEDYELSLRLKERGKVSLIPGLFVLTSARRIKKQGMLCTYWNYIINYFSVLFFYKPLPQRLENLPRKLGQAIINRLRPSRAFARLISHGSRRRQKIALTFDDGPNEPFTSRILDILGEHGIRATFFMLGKNAKRFTDVCRRIQKEGHAIGNHSYHHSRWLALKREREIAREIELSQETIHEASGAKPDLFRPPYGFWTPWMLRAARKLGYKVITWDNMTNDWEETKEASEVVSDILKKAKAGGIIVLHDGRDSRRDYDRTPLLHALPPIISTLKQRGYQFVTVPELVGE